MSWVDSAIRLLPMKQHLIERGALLPQRLRSQLSYRALSAVARRIPAPGPMMRTTMGIDDRLDCAIPPHHHLVLYGKPAFYAGERGPLALATSLCRTSDAFVDIGAHVGYFTFYVRAHCGAHLPIYFFEPDPDLYSVIERNVASNKLPHVAGYREAVGRASGTTTFYKNLSDPLSGSLETMFEHSHRVEPIEVKVTSFADFAQRAGLKNACVKVDIEGAEPQFLEGAGSFDAISSLIIELLEPAVRTGFAAKLMAQSGFTGYYINDFALEHSPQGDFAYCAPQYNWLFCRHSPAQLAHLLRGSPFRVIHRPT